MFMRFRKALCHAAGLGDLESYAGFERWGEPPNTKEFPTTKKEPLVVLLDHSDCDGSIPWRQTKRLADRIEELIPALSTEPSLHPAITNEEKARQFVDGLRLAWSRHESVGFH